MEDFKTYCKNYILDHIGEFEGQMAYGCDFGYALTQEPNANGTLTFSRYDAKEYLREWFDECGEYWWHEEMYFGGHEHNPFNNPEAYMVCMVIAGVNAILANEPHIEENWNDEFELTAEVIESIKVYVEEFDGEMF